MPTAPDAVIPSFSSAAPSAPVATQVSGAASAPDAPVAVFVPAVSAGGIPDTLSVTVDPGTGEVTVELERGSDVSSYASWSDGGDWVMSAYQESPESVIEWFLSTPGYDAYKPVGGTSNPVGLTGWSLTFGGEQPVITAAGFEPLTAPAAIIPAGTASSPAAPEPVFGTIMRIADTDAALLTDTDAAVLTN